MTANIANIVFPGVFNPKTDKWRDYKEQLMCALDAAGVGQDNLNKGRSLFLSQCGRDTYALIASLLVPKRPVDVDLIEIFNILDKFYHPEVNEILEAGKFHKRQQEHGESLQDFVAAINSLSAKCNFSDLKQAYTQLKVDEETAKLLTWNTHIGLMKVNRLAFGVSAAPAIFQRVMSSALAGMEGVACLLDDIAITGATKEEHDGRLRQVLKKLQELGLRLNIKKCVFAANSITFLGHMIDADGLHPSPAKVKEILEKPAPTNRETLRAFLGLYNFYEKFLPDKSTVLEPLYRLLESKRPWTWGDKEHTAFNEAKRLLSSDLTLVGYDLNKEILLICDSSEYGLGAIIAHIMEDGGLQRRHIDQILARPNRVEPSEHPRESGAEESSEDDLTPIIIPPPELWPDMSGIPNTD